MCLLGFLADFAVGRESNWIVTIVLHGKQKMQTCQSNRSRGYLYMFSIRTYLQLCYVATVALASSLVPTGIQLIQSTSVWREAASCVQARPKPSSNIIDHIKTHIYIREITLQRDQRNNINEFSFEPWGGGGRKGNYKINLKRWLSYMTKKLRKSRDIKKRRGVNVQRSSSK